MNRQQRLELLRQLALEQAIESYKEEYILETDQETLILKGLAKLLSTITDWDEDAILEVAADALTDSNSHSIARTIRNILNVENPEWTRS